MRVTPYGSVTIASLSGCVVNGQPMTEPWIAYGFETGSCSQPSGTYGIVFNTPTGYSNASGGSFFPVQLISSETASGSYNHSWTANLDKQYPYGLGSFPTSDTPDLGLFSTDTTVTLSFSANMFVMWQSSTANSIPVPLGYQTWGFSGTANCSSSCGSPSNWTATTNGTPGPVGNFVPSAPSQTSVGNNTLVDGYPTWTGVSQ